MTTDPFAPPVHSSTAPSFEGDIRDLIEVARQHRRLCIGVLTQIFMTTGFMGLAVLASGGPDAEPNQMIALLSLALILATLVVHIINLVSIYRLASALQWSAVSAALCVVAMFVGCVNLIVLLVLVNEGNKTLKRAGFPPGLLGVDPAHIEETTSYRSV